MSDWKQRIREAKEWVELGVMTPEEFEDLKQQARKAIGLSTNANSAASSQGVKGVLHRFHPILQTYQATMKGTWDEQHPSRLKGFLLDTLGSDVESSTVSMFVLLSFQEKIVPLVQSNDELRLQKHCQQLGKQFNSALVAECCQVWHQVFGRQGKVFPSISPKQQKSVLSRPKKSAPSVTPTARPKPPKAGDVRSFGRGSGRHEMVYIPAGEFMMGALLNDAASKKNEKPRHRVNISQSFLLGKYVVTQALYESVMGKNPSKFNGAANPVEWVSWCDAVLFCNKISEREGLELVYSVPQELEAACRAQLDSEDRTADELSQQVKIKPQANGYRLPTEAEWEYAARSGQELLYTGSNKVDEVAWYSTNSNKRTHPVGQKKANAFGLYDMSGNVFEWVWDAGRIYGNTFQTDPVGPITGTRRVLRGGAWRSKSMYSRVSNRATHMPSGRIHYLGFRLSRSGGTVTQTP